MGVDLMKKGGKDNRTALDWAEDNKEYDIIQLLRLSEISATIGDRITSKAEELKKENGIIDAFIDELSEIGEQTADIVKKALIEIMTSLVVKKKAFSDIMLRITQRFIGSGFEESELFKDGIIKTSKSIIGESDKRDWFWMKEMMIPSNVCTLILFLCANMRINVLQRFGLIKTKKTNFCMTVYWILLRLSQSDKSKNWIMH